MDIDAFLEALGLGRYASAFAKNDVDETVLAQLTDADLRELGVASLGHRKQLLAAIAARRAAPPATAPTASAPPPGDRWQVTILFADLSSFTALSQALDPEELHELVTRYTQLVDGIVLGYGGTVDKHIGDAVMALFGAPPPCYTRRSGYFGGDYKVSDGYSQSLISADCITNESESDLR